VSGVKLRDVYLGKHVFACDIGDFENSLSPNYVQIIDQDFMMHARLCLVFVEYVTTHTCNKVKETNFIF